MGLQAIYQPIEAELRQVDLRLAKQLESDNRFLTALRKHLERSPGKKLRPALVLFAARIGGQNKKQAVALAAAAELVHTATLVQDDVIDQSEVRRGEAAVSKKFGGSISILYGDYLFSQAFSLLTEINDQQVWAKLLAMASSIATGEIEQLQAGGAKLSVKKYLQIIRQKTAGFFEACCETGAIVGQASSAERKALAGFGLNFGLAFQIIDDCLDERKFPWADVVAAKKEAKKYMDQAFCLLDSALSAKAAAPFVELGNFVLAQ